MMTAQTAEKCFFISLILYAISLPITMAGTNFSLALLLASVILFLLIRRRDGQDFRKENQHLPGSILCLASFFLWAAATDWIADAHFTLFSLRSFSKLWNFLPYLLIPAGYKLWEEKGEVKSIEGTIKTLLWCGSAVALLGLVQYISGIHYFFEGWFGCRALVADKRFYGFQSHPLHSGGLYTILFLCSLSITVFSNECFRNKVPTLLGAVLLGLGVIITESRSYYLASFLGAIVILGSKGWKTLAAGLLPGMAVILCLAAMDDSIAGRIRTIQWNQTDESGRQRIYMWTAAASMIREHPFAGVGYGNWGKNLKNYTYLFPKGNMDSASYGHAHNSYLTVASETGLTGLAIFLLFWAALIREQWMIIENKITSGRKGTAYDFEYALAIGGLSTILSLFVAAFFEHNLLTATVDLALFFVLGLSRYPATA